MPIALRTDFDASALRREARRAKDAGQARRLLALAAIYDGATRTEAARIGGVTLQIVRDWVVKFNALRSFRPDRRQGAGENSAADGRSPRRACPHSRGRADPGRSWRRALATCRPLPMDVRGASGGRFDPDHEPGTACDELSQAHGSTEASCAGGPCDRGFKKAFPRAWRRSHKRKASAARP